MERKIGIQITLIKQYLDRILEKMLLEYGIDAFTERRAASYMFSGITMRFPFRNWRTGLGWPTPR